MPDALERDDGVYRYLLGHASPDERAELEGRLFSDDDFDEEVLAAADDLIQAYLAGALSPEDRAAFEGFFLTTPRHRRRLEFMRQLSAALAHTAREDPAGAVPPTIAIPKLRWWLPVAGAAAVAATALLVSWRAPVGGDHTSGVVPPTPAPSPTPRVIVASQGPEVVRARVAQAFDVVIRPRTTTVRLEIPVRGERPSYDVTLRTGDGAVVWRLRGLSAVQPPQPLVVTVPARLLVGNAYKLRVDGEALREAATSDPLTLEFRMRVVREP
jgi:anti-sigma factor RsiW